MHVDDSVESGGGWGVGRAAVLITLSTQPLWNYTHVLGDETLGISVGYYFPVVLG